MRKHPVANRRPHLLPERTPDALLTSLVSASEFTHLCINLSVRENGESPRTPASSSVLSDMQGTHT
jgi:hypothetical protein